MCNAALNTADRIEQDARREIYDDMRAAGYSHSDALRESEIEAHHAANAWYAHNVQF